ncbi:MAG TPA: TVP38/TMEM64 family protein [Gemmataceae bacterium]|nr:TVP38/TMEM64 family protein [Gemmataceae bacterium]
MRETTETQGFSWFRWALAAFLLAAIAGFYALGFSDYFSWQYLHEHLDLWKAQTNEHLPTALFLFFLVYLTITALSLPAAALLTLLAGALFDFWLGVAVVSLASTFGATLAFLSSRYLFREWVQRRFGNRLRALDEGVARDGAYYLFTLRLVPIVPFFLINLGMGLTPMPGRTFAGVSMLGMLPGTCIYVYTGRAFASIHSSRDILSPGVLLALALLGITPLLFRKLIQWIGRGSTRK